MENKTNLIKMLRLCLSCNIHKRCVKRQIKALEGCKFLASLHYQTENLIIAVRTLICPVDAAV